MKEIKKADWVVVRLLVDASVSDVDRYGSFRPTIERARAIMYLNKKYGTKTLCKAINLIRAERGESHEVHSRQATQRQDS
jgi:hypothetical protein